MKLFTKMVVALMATKMGALASQRPNVILVMTDDQGYGDIAAHGNPVIETPNLDRLHAESIRLTNFHVDPTCAPTRGALMSGKYSHHARVWHTVQGGNHLRASELTMGDVFKHSGYRTAMFGKWHIGANYPYRPIDRGFDEWVGLGDGGPGTCDDYFWNDRVNDTYWHNGTREAHPRPGYNPDVFFGAAMDIVKDRSSDQPFFIYLPTYCAHVPHTIPDPTLMKKYTDQGMTGGTASFFAQLGEVDKNIGRLRQTLVDEGVADNTIFIFMSDNGSSGGSGVFNAGMTGKKGSVTDGGHRVPCFIHWPDGGLGGPRDIGTLAAHIDLLPTLTELCGLQLPRPIDFDGTSLAGLLTCKQDQLPNRTLVVERQRNPASVKGSAFAAMNGTWRLVNGKQLYDIAVDPAQQNDIAAEYPEMVAKLAQDYERYWDRVSVDDRSHAVPIAGTPFDQEIFLTTADLRESTSLYRHNDTSEGDKAAGVWHLEIAKAGTYEFEVRRWPTEVSAPMTGVPVATKTVDSWNGTKPIKNLIYGNTFKALPIASVSLSVGDFSSQRPVVGRSPSVVFNVQLPAGKTKVESVFYDGAGKELTHAYYVYVRKK